MAVDLEQYILNQMRMSHIYQPVMLKVLLENNGSATVEEIATSLLTYDQSQIEYYNLRTKKMVGKVLPNNSGVDTMCRYDDGSVDNIGVGICPITK